MYDEAVNRVITNDETLLEGRKIKDPEEIENERLIRRAEEDFEVEFKWFIDTEEDPRDWGEEDAAGKEYYYCVAKMPDGRRETLAGIEDPDPSYKKSIEAISPGRSIKPDYLPPETEDLP